MRNRGNVVSGLPHEWEWKRASCKIILTMQRPNKHHAAYFKCRSNWPKMKTKPSYEKDSNRRNIMKNDCNWLIITKEIQQGLLPLVPSPHKLGGTLQHINPKRSDEVPGQVLTAVLTDLFNIPLEQAPTPCDSSHQQSSLCQINQPSGPSMSFSQLTKLVFLGLKHTPDQLSPGLDSGLQEPQSPRPSPPSP